MKKSDGSLLALLTPKSAGSVGTGSKPPSAAGTLSDDTAGADDDSVMMADDVLAAIKSRDPSRLAESLRAFIDMG